MVLEALGRSAGGLSLGELSEGLGIPKNSVFRIAATLETRGYVERDEAGRRFRLTRRWLHLSGPGAESTLFERSIDVMRRLREATRETVLLGVMIGDEGVVLEQAPGLHPFKFMVDPGTRFHLHTSAPGKAMLAALPEAERRAVVERLEYPRFNVRTITDAERFGRHLGSVAERGYAFDLAEEHEGQYCVGAAIRDGRGHPQAAIWITAPSSRIPDAELDAVGRIVRSHAEEISGRFGYFDAPPARMG